MRGIRTRFRAYYLGSAGLSFSYFADGPFTMIEARLTGESRDQVEREMTEKCGVDHAYVLHNGFTTKRFLNHIEPQRSVRRTTTTCTTIPARRSANCCTSRAFT